MDGSFTSGALAGLLEAELVGRDDLDLTGIDPIDDAAAGSLTFIRSAQYASKWAESEASAALVTRGIEVAGHDPESRALLVVDDADRSLVVLLEKLQRLAAAPPPPVGVHETASVDPGASVDPSASIGPHCVVAAGAAIGAGTVLHANVSVGTNARVGDRCTFHPSVVVYHGCTIGDRCVLHANVTIGADGFGYLPHPSGRGLVKIPHIGNVVIGDDVEVGPGTAIDRGKTGPTTIGDGVKIDNLVQIAHNCVIGPGAVICGQVGLAGSCRVGAGAMIGGQAGVKDNTSIGAGAQVGAQAGVMRDIEEGEVVFGTPAVDARLSFRRTTEVSRLGATLERIRARLRALERGDSDTKA